MKLIEDSDNHDHDSERRDNQRSRAITGDAGKFSVSFSLLIARTSPITRLVIRVGEAVGDLVHSAGERLHNDYIISIAEATELARTQHQLFI